METQLIDVDGNGTLFVKMNNTVERFIFMKHMEGYGEIIKYYWRSKYDETHIEYTEPKIWDAYYFHVDYEGRTFVLGQALRSYKLTQTDLDRIHCERCLSLTEKEIQEIALKAMNNMNLFV